MVGVRRLRGAVLVTLTTLIAIGWLAMAPSPARAEGENWKITRYQAVATAEAAGGDTLIVLDFDFDFGDDAGHGPLLVFPDRVLDHTSSQRKWRDLDTRIESATSSSGASAAVQTTRRSGQVRVRIGDPDATVTGVQSYQVRYRVKGFIDPGNQKTGLDEFSWTVMGVGFEIPVAGITVTLKAPAPAIEADCYREIGHSVDCPAPAPAASMTWTLDRLNPGDNLRVEASFPAGTFTDADAKTSTLTSPMAATPATVAVSVAVVVAVGALVLVMLLRRRGSGPVAMQSGLVPEGSRPGEIAGLVRQKADSNAITATIVDLAARGYLVIHPQPDQRAVLTMQPHDPSGLAPYEYQLMETLFTGRAQLTTLDLANATVGDGVVKVTTALMAQLSTEPTRWFTGDPRIVRTKWLVAGVAMLLVGLVAWLPLALLWNWGLPPLVLAIAGVAVMIGSRWIPTLTPQGSAARQQALGLQRFLGTAQTQQIPFEQGRDVFSRYLPFAIALGQADRWVGTFGQLAAAGSYQPDLGWLGGTNGPGATREQSGHAHIWGWLASAPDFRGITASLDAGTRAAAAVVDSGSAGGGGSGGGGGGGW